MPGPELEGKAKKPDPERLGPPPEVLLAKTRALDAVRIVLQIILGWEKKAIDGMAKKLAIQAAPKPTKGKGKAK